MRLNIVSVRSVAANGGASRVCGSGVLIDAHHVLTAAHVWRDAIADGAVAQVSILPRYDGALPAQLVGAHGTRDAALLRVIDWEAPDDVVPPTMAEEYVSINGQAVELQAVSPLTGQAMVASNYSVSSYDNQWQEFELTPEVAQGNSGGAVVYDGRFLGLVSSRAKNQPIARALALHSLLPWIRGLVSTPGMDKIDTAPQVVAQDAGEPCLDSDRGIAGLSHRLGSIHLHVDGAQASEFVSALVDRHNNAGVPAELAWVVEAKSGPQRRDLGSVYDLHNPGDQQGDALDYFSTSQLYPGPDMPTAPDRRLLALSVLDTLCDIHALGESASGVVLELERVVGSVDEQGMVGLVAAPVMRGTNASLESQAALRLFAPFNTRKLNPPGLSAYELHFSLDLERRPDDTRPPIALADLCELVRRAKVELGGWFLFRDPDRWAYRSNGFVPSVSAFALQTRWRNFRAQLDANPNERLRTARLRLLAEETLAVWRTPLLMVQDGLRTVNGLAEWEQNFPDLEEFWVLLPNFLGDQNDQVRVAMLANFNRRVRYVYFLRSNADARRWLDFRAEMQKENEWAERLMTAFVVSFNTGGPYDQLAAFFANPRSDAPEGYELRVDAATNRVLYGDSMEPAKIRSLVETHSRAIGSGDITYWYRVQGSGSDQTIVAVCANLLDEPDELLFERLDSQLALLASRHAGSVEVYGNRSITVVFEGNRQPLERAILFVRQALLECPKVADESAPFVMRMGIVSGQARLAARASGMMWTGAAIRGSRRLLDQAPRQPGAYVSDLSPPGTWTVPTAPAGAGVLRLLF